MPDPTNDTVINALLDCLDGCLSVDQWQALTALVAERSSLKQRVAELEAQTTESFQRVSDLIAEKWRLQDRIKELEAHHPADRDRDLRERLVESALQGSGCRLGIMKESDAEELGRQAAWIVNGALAAMRKGDECNR